MKRRDCKNLGKLKDENGEPFDWCEKVIDCPDTQMERNCKHFVAATNADRIRAMTDEELAEWVWGAETAGRAYGPRGKKAWLGWLKQEAVSNG